MRTIGIVNLASGVATERDPDSLTLDIPADLDRASGGVELNADSLGHYLAAGALPRVYAAHPTLLETRERGQQCLVADEEIAQGGTSAVRQYRLYTVSDGRA